MYPENRRHVLDEAIWKGNKTDTLKVLQSTWRERPQQKHRVTDPWWLCFGTFLSERKASESARLCGTSRCECAEDCFVGGRFFLMSLSWVSWVGRGICVFRSRGVLTPRPKVACRGSSVGERGGSPPQALGGRIRTATRVRATLRCNVIPIKSGCRPITQRNG